MQEKFAGAKINTTGEEIRPTIYITGMDMEVAEDEIKKEVERARALGDCRVTGIQPIYGNCREATVEVSE